MDAAAIMAIPAVNVEPVQSANTPQAAGDFKAVLNQQVTEQTTEDTVSKTALTPEEEALAALPEEPVGLPDAKGLRELLEILQEILAAAGSQRGAEEAETPKKADADKGGNGEKAVKGLKGTAEMLAELAAALGISMTGTKAEDLTAADDTSSGMTAVTGTAVTGTAVDETAVDETAVTGTAENSGRKGRPASKDGLVDPGKSGTAWLVAKETLAILQSVAPMTVGTSSPQLQTEKDRKMTSELGQKLTALVNRFIGGEDVTRELGELIRNSGIAPVLKEMKKLLNGVTGRGNETADKLMDAISAAAGRTPVFTVEKTSKAAENPAEQAREQGGLQRQDNPEKVVPAHNAGSGSGENSNTLIQTPNSEFVNRNASSQPSETVRNINSFARWTEDIIGKIGEKARLILGNGQSEMQIQLKPEFLGKVNLQVTIEDGRITARIGVENLQVKELVEANLKQLQQNLDSQGIKVSDLVVDLSANRNFHSFNRHQAYGTGKPVRISATGSGQGYGGLSLDDPAGPVRWLDTNSTVDYIA